ncbi:MAG TPA: glycoside hydrolase family 95 protein [Chryseosolibacter sp.]|nr:glycoside hydrolase family 95 protein [Chryseosolibacter sp.]
MPFRPPVPIVLILLSFTITVTTGQTPQNELKLWYTQPAANWNEALPVGNGRLGAMIFGGIHNERFQLNEETVWTGRDNDFVNPGAKQALNQVRKLLFAGKYYEAQQLAQAKLMGDKKDHGRYQTLGDLKVSFHDASAGASNYKRELDLNTALAKITYHLDGVNYVREIFSSAPDQVLVLRITADKPGSVSALFELTRPGNRASIKVSGNEITMFEHVDGGNGVKLNAVVKIIPEKGAATEENGALRVKDADAVTVLISAATDYWDKDPLQETKNAIDAAQRKDYQQLKTKHIEDYQRYFHRLKLDLGSTDAVYFPTDLRLAAMQKGNEDPHLIQLYYQYGRYLLISSSRPGDLPANLQGIWADGLDTPWDADYHININIQMNYWPAEVTNLRELHRPFIEFINALRPDGRKTARDMYGVGGAVAHFTTNVWHFTEPYGKTQWAMWPMGLAWCAQHPWQHYLFNEDKKFLADLGYPIMRDAAEFCLQWLVRDPKTGNLVSGPSISPENTFRTKTGEIATMVMGPTMDHMIIRELFQNTIAASRVLKVDAALAGRLETALAKLAPVELTKDGRIREWTEEFEEPEPGHRHISHLYGLFPGNEISANNKELLEAARKTIDHRLEHGGGHTGWSRAWIINFFARLQDGEQSYDNLLALLRKSTLPNLFDNHPPFQIDGNFGATAGITEMLVQSHDGEINILPALPSAWKTGAIQGACARGGFELDIAWESGELKKLTIRSKEGKPCKLRFRDKVKAFGTKPGEEYVFNTL